MFLCVADSDVSPEMSVNCASCRQATHGSRFGRLQRSERRSAARPCRYRRRRAEERARVELTSRSPPGLCARRLPRRIPDRNAPGRVLSRHTLYTNASSLTSRVNEPIGGLLSDRRPDDVQELILAQPDGYCMEIAIEANCCFMWGAQYSP